jgi:hypothetical protein
MDNPFSFFPYNRRNSTSIAPWHPTRRLDFWETSRDETTGEIRFRRQTQFVARTEGQAGDSASSTALPMGRLVRTQPQAEERFVERFEARDIELDDDSESMPDKKRSMAIEDDKLEPGWAHAK